MALEVCAIEDAAANITNNDIAELEEIQNKQTGMIQALKQQGLESFDVLAFIFLDRSFHCHIYDPPAAQLLRPVPAYGHAGGHEHCGA